jgi:hypothetical protein
MLSLPTLKISWVLILILSISVLGLGGWAMSLKEENGKKIERIQQLEFEIENNRKILALSQKRLEVSERSRRDFLTRIKHLQAKHLREKKDMEAVIDALHAQETVLRNNVIRAQTFYPELLTLIHDKHIALQKLQSIRSNNPDAESTRKLEIEQLKKELQSLNGKKDEYEKEIGINRQKLASIECLSIIIPELIRGELFGRVQPQPAGAASH